jgi:hypothetical protein
MANVIPHWSVWRMDTGPYLDSDGNEQPLFWVQCYGCGHEFPAKAGYLPRGFASLAIGEDGGEEFYSSPGCVDRAASRLAIENQEPVNNVFVWWHNEEDSSDEVSAGGVE